MRQRFRAGLVAVTAAGLLLAASALAADPPAAGPAAPTPTRAWLGRVLVRVTARAAPSDSAPARTVLRPQAPFSGNGTVVLITRATTVDGVPWVEVLLPVRPNGSRGWIRQDVLRLSVTHVRVQIDLSARRLWVYRSGRVAMTARIVIGAPATPTPTGRDFAIAERVVTGTPGGFLGPIVLPLTGYSQKLNEFAGGNGRVAIHGTSVPSLIGTAASHGCMRMRNADIVRFARLAQPGTPVAIRR